MKRVLVRGPALTQSGYGEHTRLVLRSLRSREEELDIYLLSTSWGATNWIFEDDEERVWLDSLIQKTAMLMQQKQMPQPDVSVQVTIPLEWERMAPINIGVTAGIETTKIAGEWIEKANMMDKIIVPSQFARYAFDETSYDAQNQQTGEIVKGYKNETPIEVIPYPRKEWAFGSNPLSAEGAINFTTDFNFLSVAQWGPRKNLENLVKWFIEENFDRENVGLVLKTNLAKNCEIDRVHCIERIKVLLDHEDYKEKKCKVYLLHGYMTEEEMALLYRHKDIHAFITTTHGEGYGLPLFEAAQAGLPIIAPAWSGHTDFLTMPVKGKNKFIPLKVDYEIRHVQKEVVWDKVITPDSMWCFPKEGSFKMKMRSMMENHGAMQKKATQLAEWLKKEWPGEDKIKEKFLLSFNLIEKLESAEYVFVSDFFNEQYSGGAEMSLQTIIDEGPGSVVKFNSSNLNKNIINFYKNSTWIFGNIAQLNKNTLEYILNNDINYYFIEFDYKFCEYRNPVLYEFLEEETCNYLDTELGQTIASFINKSQATFFMSEEQLQVFKDCLDIKTENVHVLSSLFDASFFNSIASLKDQKIEKNDKWLILGSRSWVKGSQQTEEWCKENKLEYDIISGLEYVEVLKKMQESKGVVFHPAGYDTCPRFVIEAKLLGCDLKLNKNVQHANEEWFNKAPGEIIAYLKERPSYFWQVVNNE